MQPQEWRELKEGDRVVRGGVEFTVKETHQDSDFDQAIVIFQDQNGEEVATARVPNTFLIVAAECGKALSEAFVSEAMVVK